MSSTDDRTPDGVPEDGAAPLPPMPEPPPLPPLPWETESVAAEDGTAEVVSDTAAEAPDPTGHPVFSGDDVAAPANAPAAPASAGPGPVDGGVGRDPQPDAPQPSPDLAPPLHPPAAPAYGEQAPPYARWPSAAPGTPAPGAELAPLQPPAPPEQYGHYPPQQPYAQPYPGQYPPAPMKRANGLATAGFVVGLVSVFLPLVLGLIGGAVGLVLSIVGVTKHDDATQSGKGLGIAGIVLSAVAIVFIL